MSRSTIESRLEKLESADRGAERVHTVEGWCEKDFEREIARREATGEIRKNDLVVCIRKFGPADE